uniref:hypothetical protein n=1 Tax=Proteus mirabilis TaxID=584 RepID=UPI0019546311
MQRQIVESPAVPIGASVTVVRPAAGREMAAADGEAKSTSQSCRPRDKPLIETCRPVYSPGLRTAGTD